MSSYWDLPIGALFLMPWDKSTKVLKPYVRVSECEFSRPGGKRRWIMFRPDFVCVFPQMIVPLASQEAAR